MIGNGLEIKSIDILRIKDQKEYLCFSLLPCSVGINEYVVIISNQL